MFLAVTSAPATRAPEGSSTTPETLPIPWPRAAPIVATRANITSNPRSKPCLADIMHLQRFMTDPPSCDDLGLNRGILPEHPAFRFIEEGANSFQTGPRIGRVW